jgi:hypothetical protein
MTRGVPFGEKVPCARRECRPRPAAGADHRAQRTRGLDRDAETRSALRTRGCADGGPSGAGAAEHGDDALIVRRHASRPPAAALTGLPDCSANITAPGANITAPGPAGSICPLCRRCPTLIHCRTVAGEPKRADRWRLEPARAKDIQRRRNCRLSSSSKWEQSQNCQNATCGSCSRCE